MFILQKEIGGKEQAVHFHTFIKSGEGQWMLSILPHISGCAMYLVFPGAQENWKSHFVFPESCNFYSTADNMLSTVSADLCFVHGTYSKDKIDFGVGERNGVKSPYRYESP